MTTPKQSFYDRKEELENLNAKYDEINKHGTGKMLALYGRRRVGKTELVKKFLENKTGCPKLYFYVDLAEEKVLLDALTKAVFEQLNERMVFREFDDFFNYIIEKSKKECIILTIDEFQRFNDIAPQIITSMQKHWDNALKNEKIMILLVGSSIGMMQKITESKSGALYNRAIRIKISPFKYKDYRMMFTELSEEKVTRYAVFGGTPYYLEKTKRFKDTLEAIDELVLKKNGELFEEPKTLMEYENVRIHAKYNSILQSISMGKEIMKEINDYTKIPTTTLPPYINRLEKLLDLIEKNDPLLGKERLKRYKIKDYFFRFWYKFIFENQSALGVGNKELVFNKIKKDLNAYVGKVFEDIAKELLIAYNGKEIKGVKINFETIGSWWDRKSNELDVVAQNRKERTLLVGEVKWTNDPVETSILDNLIAKSKFLNTGGKYDFFIISKSGFTENCKKQMDEKGILHIDLKEMAELFNKLNNK